MKEEKISKYLWTKKMLIFNFVVFCFKLCFARKKLASVVALDARGKQKSHSEEIIRNIFLGFFILQLFLAAFFWFFFTSLFFICCICAIVLLNKIDKKMFQKKFFH
jgi:Na+/H+ antiporter NhaD/arsenite permease-like protein